jgi:hypothetical protein
MKNVTDNDISKRQDLPKHEHIEMPLVALEIPGGRMGHELILDEGGEVHVYHDDGVFEIINASEESKKIWPKAKFTKHVKRVVEDLPKPVNSNNGIGRKTDKK